MKTLLICLLALFTINIAKADPIKFSGNVGLQFPAGTTDRFKDDSPRFVADLRLPNVLGPLTITGYIRHSLRNNFTLHPFSDENLFRVEGELPVCKYFIAYCFFERRYSFDANRIIAGFRIPFGGKL